MSDQPTVSEKLRTLYRISLFRPVLFASIVGISLFAALLEGFGLSFLLPIIELARSDSGAPSDPSGAMEVFVDLYAFFNVPLTLETVVVGVALVMTARYGSTFLVAWFRGILQASYIRNLQVRAFESALEAEVSYFDRRGSDEVVNTIVTEIKYSGNLLRTVTQFIEQGLLALMYLAIAIYLAPQLTLLAAVILGGLTFVLRSGLESGFDVGDRVANANENLQEQVQAGTQGIRDVKLFTMTDEMAELVRGAASTLSSATISLQRNQAALENLYQLATAITVFTLIYAAVAISSLSLASLGVFLFAMFRLAPRMSTLNNKLYNIEGYLPHAVRTQEFTDELEASREDWEGDRPLPDRVESITFDDVSFRYETGEEIFDELSISLDSDKFVAFVGPSGAGKSTIVSLLTCMYEPDEGTIRADGTPIGEFDLDAWRSHLSVVRQHPYIFNDTLRENIVIANREATQADVERVCEIASVTEFIKDLPDGYDTVLGDDGVRLSGGQKQRVAIARALLKDADFLVLDEATSDLDAGIEERVHGAIESMERDYGVLVIAHRLSTVISADTIAAVEDGRIVESGGHNELIEQGGIYASLFESQTSVA